MQKNVVKKENAEEYIERIVVSLCNKKIKKGTKCEKIQFTGCGPQCGTTMVVARVAAGLADAGYRTLVINCDFRKQTKEEVESGLGELLSTLENPMRYVNEEEEGYSYLPIGSLDNSIVAVLSSERFRDVLQRLGEMFDFILLDVPPVTIMPEALLVMQHIEGAVLVSRINVTKKKQISRAKEMLSSYGEQYYGMIINGMDKKEYHKLFQDYQYLRRNNRK